VFPPILAVFRYTLYFYAPHCQIAWGGKYSRFYVKTILSRRRLQQLDTRGERWPHHACQFLAAWWVLSSTAWHSLLTSSHSLLFLAKWQKDWVRMTSERSLKLKNTQRQEIPLCRIKTKIKGIV
jgi:hypothetical protein